ncbi:MATE family efflux transporter [Mucilaginibacter corticis]|uniref:Multidrug-efflux transporter n=1 Tax=Mucilaginibacter corticis TaxID=2597670 RepID=A0A556MGZ0_9SPHI|nr:MATE family efflux transporter [Mucilaginibacter corticis]TSJ39196.1 MATE family efflux transporter [Mucilaginibacter corticis]
MLSVYKKHRAHYGDNLRLAIPVVISQLGHTLVQTSDTIIVGHFAGTVSLAAVSLASSIFVVPMIIGIGISYGSTPLIAQYNGRKEFKECGQLLSNSLFINLITGFILFGLVCLGSIYFLDQLHQSPQVLKQAKPFLMLLGLSVIPMLVFNTFKQFAEGLGLTKQAMMISIWGNIFNICLGITFVKGLFGIHPMGIMGVGYSTLIDRCTMAIVMAVYVFRSRNFKQYLKDFAIRNIDRISSFKILKIGAPVALQYTFEISAFSAAAVMIGTIGLDQLAAHQIAINMASITYMMSSGLSAAAAIKSGNYFGVKDHHGLRLSANASYHIVLIFMSITALIFTFGNNVLPWIYTSDKNVILIASQLLILAAVFQLFDGAQVVGLGILRGMGDVNIPTAITFLAYWIVGLPIGYFWGIRLDWGIAGVWYGLVLGLMVSAVLLFIRFKMISKHHRNNQSVIIAQD